MPSAEPERRAKFLAPWFAPAFFIALSLLVGSLLLIGFRFLNAPGPVQWFAVGMIACCLLFSLEIALYRLRVSPEGIEEFRWGRRSYQWEDVVGWTKWSETTLFIRLRNGRTIGTDRPGFGKSEVAELADLLTHYAGPMTQGDQAILPWYFEMSVGGLMRGGPRR